MAQMVYSIKKNRLKRSYIKGFDLNGDTELVLDKNSLFHEIFLSPLDGVENERYWGRLHFDIRLSEDMIYYVHVLATDQDQYYDDDGRLVDISRYLLDESIDVTRKARFISELGGKRFVGLNDILLYELKGRYLYVGVELYGTEEAMISNIKVDAIGDNFMNAFPEIYKERNSFFHRYMSLFSSVYNDMQDEIDHVYEVLDLDTCSTELLVTYGSWLGIDLSGGFLPDDVLRTLVKELYYLSKIKGTKECLTRLLEILIGKEIIVIEHSYLKNFAQNVDTHISEGIGSGSVYDVTVLVKGKVSEELKHQVSFIIDQFKPIRTNITLVQMDNSAVLDSNVFMDMNAMIPQEKQIILDEDVSLDGIITLK